MNWYLQKPELLWEFLVFATFVGLLLARRLPSIEGFAKFVALADSKGGNILILLFMSFISLVWSIRFGYYAIHVVQAATAAGKTAPPDATIAQMLSWLTGSVSGGFFGALIKTMTGEHQVNGSPSVPTSVAITTTPTGGQNAENPQK